MSSNPEDGFQEKNLLDFFDRPSSELPEDMLSRLGRQGVANLRADYLHRVTSAQDTLKQAEEAHRIAAEELRDLNADVSVIHAAAALGNDRGLE